MWKRAQRRQRTNTYWSRNPNPGLLTPKLWAETLYPMAFYHCHVTSQFASVCFLLTPNCLTLSVKIIRETQAIFCICLSIGRKGKKTGELSFFQWSPQKLTLGEELGPVAVKKWHLPTISCSLQGRKTKTTTTKVPTTRQPEGSKSRAIGNRLPRRRLP